MCMTKVFLFFNNGKIDIGLQKKKKKFLSHEVNSVYYVRFLGMVI